MTLKIWTKLMQYLLNLIYIKKHNKIPASKQLRTQASSKMVYRNAKLLALLDDYVEYVFQIHLKSILQD